MPFTLRTITGFCATVFVACSLASAATAQSNSSQPWPKLAVTAKMRLPALDVAKLEAKDAQTDGKVGRFRFAVNHVLDGQQLNAMSTAQGDWHAEADGTAVWRVEIYADAAKNLSVQLEPFYLPHGAQLRVRGKEQIVNFDSVPGTEWGPYTDANNNPQNTLPTPVVIGDTLLLELRVAAKDRDLVKIGVANVSQGYRGFESFSGAPAPKVGGCNLDVVCPEGDGYRQQIRGVAAITLVTPGEDTELCTGTLINTTAQDRRPTFITANHCLDTQAEANTVVVYYNYQSPICRARTAGLATDLARFGPTQSGSTLLATSRRSDVTLLRLNGTVPIAANPFYLGWDRRDFAPTSAAVIHHPGVKEKRISFENNPTSITTVAETIQTIFLAAGTALTVPNWDVGTTEGGSSGSALLTQDTKRIVGTLSGGGARCLGLTNNGSSDTFGRLFTGWEGEGSVSNRLKDHLDPNNTGVATLDGLDSCDAPVVNLTVTGLLEAGTDTTYRAQISAGLAPYKVEWEIDSDALIDRTAAPNSAGLATLNVRYNKRFSRNISVKVTDAANCATTITRAVDIRAPLLVPEVASTTAQICGDGDTVIEPGERWRFNTTVRNTGAVTTLGAVAQFSQSAAGQALSAPDAFGYRHSDSARGQCALNYIDISSAPVLELRRALLNFETQDEGRTAAINIGAPIEVYGESISTVMMSTNGYVVLNPSESLNGADFESNCGLTPGRDAIGKRLQVLHTDLQAGELRAGSFITCPRPSDVPNANPRCVVLEWRNMDVLSGTFVPLGGSFDMQAILYPGAREIVYQYRRVIPAAGINGAVTGLLNTGVTSNNYACPTTTGGQRVVNNSAVCFFHPQSQPVAVSGDALAFVKSVSDLGAIAPGAVASASASAEFFVNPTASCGSSATLNLLPGVDARSVSETGRSYPIQIGAAGNCQVATNCPAPAPATFRGGSFYNEIRGGNGLVAFTIPRVGQAPYFLGTWFTGEANRNPTWYSIEGEVIGDQIRAPIVKVTRNVNSPTFAVARETIGQAQISVTGQQNMVMSYQFNNGASGNDKLVHLLAANSPANPDLTGHYFRPGEGGWGQTYESFVGSVPSMFILNYIYDSVGQPRWTLAQEADSNVGNLNALSYQVHCPSCAWMDINPTVRSAGTQMRILKRDLTGKGVGIIDTNFILQPPLSGTWLRSNLDIQSITPLNPLP